MKIIPAIDIIDGQCVRLTKGDYCTKKIYSSDPVETAKEFEASGIQYLHLVDLDGAKSGQIKNAKVLENIVRETGLTVDFGGGIKTDADIETAFNAGANQITLGSIAVHHREKCLEWLAKYGAHKILLGADCLNRRLKTSGWLEDSDLEVISFIKEYQAGGIQEVICTDIAKDGMLEGPSFTLYAEILKETCVRLIASGGVSCLADLQTLKDLGCSGAILGKALYENKITLGELQKLT